MKFRDAILVAYRGLTRHWVRATLNVIGIVAGVASVIMLVSVAHAVSGTAKAAVEGLGANLVVVYPSGAASSGVQLGLGTASSLTSNDVTALTNTANVPDAVQAVPTAGLSTNVIAGAHSWQTDVIGTTPGFGIARGYTLSQGSSFGPAAVNAAQPVVIIGQTVAKEIFPDVNPINQNVLINQQDFKVIGEYAPRGYSGVYNQDDLVVMPISALWDFALPSTLPRIQQILVQASSPNVTANVANEVTNTLLRAHGITDPALADFRVQTQQDLVASAERLATVMQWMLGVVAVIALLAGGIGIMSLMLATVGERAYEIGVRRAVGASREDILGQFLIEALLLAVLGGVAGIAVGFGGATLMGDVVTDLPAPVVTGVAILIAALVALVIGVGAGLYPAVRASLLQPVEAVRRQ
ncbi:MAG TPA: ABC transporter permease [Candidatus Acidoferrales bacterium]|nr:ABC transporter permease [Candidatus Acidoferrales bacterium]